MTTATERNPELLNAAQLHQLGHLMFVARTLVEGLYAGRHASPKKGHSTEFHDYRPYVRGDDPARVDWKLYGRTDRLYVRRFRHDADLTVHLVLDGSRSMAFSGLDSSGRMLQGQTHPSKWLYASQLAAAIAYLVIRQGDRASLSVLHDAKPRFVPVGAGAGHLKHLVHDLESYECSGGLNLDRSMTQLHAQLSARGGRRGLVVMLSDFWEKPEIWMKSFHPFQHDHYDMVCLGVHTPQELTLDDMAAFRLVDMENNKSLRTYAPAIRQGYQTRVQEHHDRLESMLRGRGLDYARFRTCDSPLAGLRSFLAVRAAAGIHAG